MVGTPPSTTSRRTGRDPGGATEALESKALLGLSALCIAVTGPSRVYLGDHWATDVLGGYLFGGGWLCLALEVYFHVREKGVATKL